MTRWIALAAMVLAASACTQKDSAGSRSRPQSDPESGDGRALEVGRELIGKPAPAALLHTIDGKAIDLGKLYGRKPVYLKFWATWCVPCRQQMPGFEAEFEKYGKDIETVAVNTGFNDDLAAVRKYRVEHGLKMPITIDDGSLADALNLRVTPQHVVIGRDGRILFVGHLDDGRLNAALRQAIAEAPARVPVPAAVEAPPPLGAIEPALARAANFRVTGSIADGKPRVLVFFSPWCETYWKDSRPQFAAACRRVREQANALAPKGKAHWLGIASGLWADRTDIADHRSKKDAIQLPIYLDSNGSAFRAFGVRAVPTVIVLDSSGRIVRRLGPDDQDLSGALASPNSRS